MIYSLCLLLILVGLYGVVSSRQTLRIVISLAVVSHGVHLLLLLIGGYALFEKPARPPGRARTPAARPG